ncbi:hypothetical protein J2Z40_001333 [Cytobacillus eiseniae]|uniref:Uncharacterized protein n=1 Tax=Cytobacillus eiseniae TaxID=762947 RepID=A0ABS4RD02_9BACI|nr:hypothetical protein [Cytobacillus eiseniae]MBP2240774.1 hypothetical protein [Cytobacillus eiseniae]
MKQAPLVMEEDLQLVKEYVLLPILLDVLESDITKFRTAKLKMNDIYEKSLRQVQDQIITKMAELRKQMRERGIKVYEQQQNKLFVEAHYLCRGYHHKFSMLWNLVRAEQYKCLNMYLHIDLRKKR